MTTSGKKIYFFSDFHLGVPTYNESLKREKKLIQFFDEIKQDASEIFLVGDIFDFWYEYKKAIPKGFVRIQAKIAECTDAGIPVHYFIGNHDMWTFGYLEQELGVILHKEPIIIERNNKTIYIGHGDGCGPGDYKYKMLKKIFRFKPFQFFFGLIHPDLGIWIAQKWSYNSRYFQEKEKMQSKENEWLYVFSREQKQKNAKIDYFIFGHRHLVIEYDIEGTNAKYINLGDWIQFNSYAVMDAENIKMCYYP